MRRPLNSAPLSLLTAGVGNQLGQPLMPRMLTACSALNPMGKAPVDKAAFDNVLDHHHRLSQTRPCFKCSDKCRQIPADDLSSAADSPGKHLRAPIQRDKSVKNEMLKAGGAMQPLVRGSSLLRNDSPAVSQRHPASGNPFAAKEPDTSDLLGLTPQNMTPQHSQSWYGFEAGDVNPVSITEEIQHSDSRLSTVVGSRAVDSMSVDDLLGVRLTPNVSFRHTQDGNASAVMKDLIQF